MSKGEAGLILQGWALLPSSIDPCILANSTLRAPMGTKELVIT